MHIYKLNIKIASVYENCTLNTLWDMDKQISRFYQATAKFTALFSPQNLQLLPAAFPAASPGPTQIIANQQLHTSSNHNPHELPTEPLHCGSAAGTPIAGNKTSAWSSEKQRLMSLIKEVMIFI